MTIQVLVSTMNQGDVRKLVRSMKIKSCIVINQVTKKIVSPKDISEQGLQAYTVEERGLSRSRNRAIKKATADVCLIADDDMYYTKDYERVVLDAYTDHPDADIITFFVDNEDSTQVAKIQPYGRLNLLQTMKVTSCQISFKRNSIIDKNLLMDENFGTGTDKYMGEENIFLFDCYKKGLRIYNVPQKIAVLRGDNISTWFEGYDRKYFLVKGAVYYRMSSWLCPLLIIQFSMRKRHLFKSISFLKTIKFMAAGAYGEAMS